MSPIATEFDSDLVGGGKQVALRSGASRNRLGLDFKGGSFFKCPLMTRRKTDGRRVSEVFALHPATELI